MPAKKGENEPFRPNLYLVARFLDALARPEAEHTRATLQAAVGVNYDIFRKYLEFLAGKRYLAIHAGGRGADIIKLTAEGRAVRDELQGWIARFLGEGSFADEAPRRQAHKGPAGSEAP